MAPVHVKGINAYGGAKDTKGKIYPGNQFLQVLGLELSLTQRWALALDILNIYGNKTRFTGKKGTGATGSGSPNNPGDFNPIIPVNPFQTLIPVPLVVVGGPSFNQFSLAPALEYNWNNNLGIIGGAWFTVAGRNTADFVQWVIAFNLYH